MYVVFSVVSTYNSGSVRKNSTLSPIFEPGWTEYCMDDASSLQRLFQALPQCHLQPAIKASQQHLFPVMPQAAPPIPGAANTSRDFQTFLNS
ncbi:hypothetical protein Cni_G20899 [Canna indica]|uniref:Uncharacterized protein n=1 Tax=Canna indica TaxID=4628 RepID=A0AAQ3QI61_9LILI|nr:hypothetical protein Cni_G20899 [Canna indica]